MANADLTFSCFDCLNEKKRKKFWLFSGKVIILQIETELGAR
jgi:hypothetical protein